MPRFPVTFRRRSTAQDDTNGAVAEPSFRVLDRGADTNMKSFDGGARMARGSHSRPKTSASEIVMEDNLFAGLTHNRYVHESMIFLCPVLA